MPRVVIPGCAHHITQRGNRREDIFFSDRDRLRYLELLDQYAEAHGLSIQAYCLMSNHIHLVVVPEREDSLAAALKPVHARYAQHVNWTQSLSGYLWQGRFRSCTLDTKHLWAAVRYVELNPVRAGLVDHAEDWQWSSARGHCGLVTDALLNDPCGMQLDVPTSKWLQLLRDPWSADDDKLLTNIRARTRTGRPAATASFTAELEQATGRNLTSRRPGRPKKDIEDTTSTDS